MTGLLSCMTGAELLMLRVTEGEAVADAVDEELDRRALDHEPNRLPTRTDVSGEVRTSVTRRAA